MEPSPSIHQDPLNVEQFTKGLLQIYQPELQKSEKLLRELRLKGGDLLEKVHDENLSLSEIQCSNDLLEMFKMVQQYQGKLVKVRRNMRHVHDKVSKLKQRASKIQQYREDRKASSSIS